MMLKNELVRKIKDYFNLNIYETKVWLALLSKGIASAGEIAEISGVPRSRTYDVLESLEKQGFAIPKVGKPAKFIAVKPETILEKLKRNALERAEEKVKILEKLKETQEYDELNTLHNSSTEQVKKQDISGSLTGRANILTQLKEMFDNSKEEFIVCMTASDFNSESRAYKNLLEKALNSKIKFKIAINGTDEELKQIAKKHNIKPIKTNLKSKFFIADKKQALFSVTSTAENETAVWLNSEFFSNSLACLFESAHKK